MRVYILLEYYPDDTGIIGVFDSREKAEEHKQKYLKDNKYLWKDDLTIIEEEVK